MLESRPRLGGRASSFVDRTTGETIDNCQHVSMGCCTNFAHFCRSLGLDRALRRETTLYFIGPDGRTNAFQARPLPAPLHLLPAFRRLSYLSTPQLRTIARGLKALVKVRENAAGETFSRWLARHGQPEEVIERFWDVVLVSALSETMDRIDVLHARKVFVDGFLANRTGWEVQIPTIPLDNLYGTKVVDWLDHRGATVRLQAGVERVVIDGDRVIAAELRNGERLAADEFILAVPHERVLGLLPESLAATPPLASLGQLESAPISSIHLWFDRPVTELPHAVLIGRTSQWVFNRTALQHEAQGEHGRPAASAPNECYLQVVISASRNLDGRSQESIIGEVVEELRSVWPAVGDAQLVHQRMVTEHRAVFSVLPGIDALRPPQQSPVANLQFAGDWTRTGWPATMEGAVRSGYLAAENVLSRLGRPEKILQPDLPVAFLSRLLLGL